MKHQSYLNRALKANDRRFARIFSKMGYNTTDLVPEEVENLDISALRETYESLFGKKPFMGWDTAMLLGKIEEKRAEG